MLEMKLSVVLHRFSAFT